MTTDHESKCTAYKPIRHTHIFIIFRWKFIFLITTQPSSQNNNYLQTFQQCPLFQFISSPRRKKPPHLWCPPPSPSTLRKGVPLPLLMHPTLPSCHRSSPFRGPTFGFAPWWIPAGFFGMAFWGIPRIQMDGGQNVWGLIWWVEIFELRLLQICKRYSFILIHLNSLRHCVLGLSFTSWNISNWDTSHKV